MRALFYFFLACLLLAFPAAAIRQVNYTADLNIQNPVAIASDNQGRLYIAQQKGIITIVDKNQVTVKVIGGNETPWPDLLVSPAGLCFHKDKLYVTDASLNRISVFTRDGDFIECYGKKGSGPGEFDAPAGICIHQNVIYVADTGNSRVQALGEKGGFLYATGLSENNQPLRNPFQVAVDYAGRIYAADKDGQINIYDGAGHYLRKIPDIPPVSAFCLDNEGLVIADKSLCSIAKYAFDFKKIFSFGTKGENRGQFKDISSILSTGDGKIYIADAKKSVIQIFTVDKDPNQESFYTTAAPPTSAIWTKIIATDKKLKLSRLIYAVDTIYTIAEGEPSIGIIKNGQPMTTLPLEGIEPESVAVDRKGNLYVLANKSVIRLSRNGKAEFTFDSLSKRASNDMAITGNGLIYITDRANKKINIFNTDGISIGSFAKAEPDHPILDPVALAVDNADGLYLLDRGDQSVAVFSPEGNFLNRFLLGDLTSDPVDLAVATGKIYVLDGQGNHVKLFSAAGKPIARFAATGEGVGSLDGPVCIAAKNDTGFLVYEHNNRRIQEFSVRYTPRPPENATAVADAGKILVQWDKTPDPGVNEYIIYRADNNNKQPIKVGQTAERSYADGTVTSDVNYSYRVTAKAKDGNESDMTPPLAASFSMPGPGKMTVIPRDISVKLSWQPVPREYASEYFVYLGDEKVASTTATEITVDELLAETYYVFRVTAVNKDKAESKPSSISVTTLPTTRPPVEIEVLELSDIFSGSYKIYEQDGIGKLVVRNNTGELISKLNVMFSIKNFMDFPSEIVVTDLPPGKYRELLLKGVFNDSILNVSEDTPVQTEITASYYLRGEPQNFSVKKTVNVYEKHKMRWDDPLRIGAFVTTKDPLILELVRNVITQYKYSTDPLVSACVIFNALGVTGISYVIDPANSYQETKDNTDLIDYLQYPRETISRKSGDCDDLVVLYSSALESMGTRTKFVEVPGHIFLMFMIGHTSNLGRDTLNDLLVIEEDGSVWVPVEATKIGRPFTDAWEAGSRAYQQGKKQGALSTIDVRSSWEKYKPASLPPPSTEPIKIDRQVIDKASKNEFEVIRQTSLKIHQREHFRRLEADPNDPDARMQLGIAYAKFGMLDEAGQFFDKALKSRPADASLLNNSGNIMLMKKNYDKAIELYQKAVEADPADALVRVNLAKALLEAGKKQEAKKAFQDACRLDPDIAGQYRSLALKLPGPG